jgi:hypothetical protein
MPRGGARRKSTWKSGESTVVRIPKAYEAEIILIARALDACEFEKRKDVTLAIYTSEDKNWYIEAIKLLTEALDIPANKGGGIKKNIKKALKLLHDFDAIGLEDENVKRQFYRVPKQEI